MAWLPWSACFPSVALYKGFLACFWVIQPYSSLFVTGLSLSGVDPLFSVPWYALAQAASFRVGDRCTFVGWSQLLQSGLPENSRAQRDLYWLFERHELWKLLVCVCITQLTFRKAVAHQFAFLLLPQRKHQTLIGISLLSEGCWPRQQRRVWATHTASLSALCLVPPDTSLPRGLIALTSVGSKVFFFAAVPPFLFADIVLLFDSGGGGGGGVALELGDSTAGGSPFVEPSIWLDPVALLFSFRTPRLWDATSDITLGGNFVKLPNLYELSSGITRVTKDPLNAVLLKQMVEAEL